MIERLRLGTRVVTSNPVWPHIRKIAHNCHHTQYVCTRAGAVSLTVTADLTKTDDPTEADVLTIDPHGARLTEADLSALVEHVQADLSLDPDHTALIRVHLHDPMLQPA